MTEYRGSTGETAPLVEAPAVLPEYREWLERLEATYRSVGFCCWHRLGDWALAEQVSAQVVAGLLARPSIFRQWGLPYSGRIAHLAESRIAAAREGTLPPGGDWAMLTEPLLAMSLLDQRVFVLAWVEGLTDEEIATELDVDAPKAQARREAILHQLELVVSAVESTQRDQHEP